MAETKLGSLLGKVSFEDVLDPIQKTPLPEKKDDTKLDDVTLPEKPADVADLKIDDNQNQEESFYESLSKIMGYEVEGEFDESVEGVAEYAKAVAERIAQEEIKDLFESFPDVKEYLQFRLNNGDPAKYFESKYGEVDYSQYSVTEEDVTSQESIVRRYLKNEGYTDEEIIDTIKDYKETNLLYKTAKRLQDRLIDNQKYMKEELLRKQAEEARELEEQRQEMISQINSTIEKGNLHNFTIPEKERKEFRAWMLQPDSRGVTKRQLDMKNLTLEQKLELEYLLFKGFDLKDLVKKEATQTRINFLKNQTSKVGSRLGGVPSKTKPGTSALSNLKLTDIL